MFTIQYCSIERAHKILNELKTLGWEWCGGDVYRHPTKGEIRSMDIMVANFYSVPDAALILESAAERRKAK